MGIIWRYYGIIVGMSVTGGGGGVLKEFLGGGLSVYINKKLAKGVTDILS